MNKNEHELAIVIAHIDAVKYDLMNCMSRLEESGYKRKAETLGTIIAKLEHWENTK